VLMFHRPGDPYAMWVFWDEPERAFSMWYVNFQTLLTRSAIGFDMLDHELDLWSSDGKTWHWKDDEPLDQRVAQRLFAPEEAEAIRADAARVHAELQARGIWWDPAWVNGVRHDAVDLSNSLLQSLGGAPRRGWEPK